MKPKEFIEKYGIQGGWNHKHQTNFLHDFTIELIVMLEYNKAVDNIKGFDNALRTIRQSGMLFQIKYVLVCLMVCGVISLLLSLLN